MPTTTRRRFDTCTPAGNAAKVTELLTRERGVAVLYRTRIAGPRGQRAYVAVGRVAYIDGRDEYERTEYEISIHNRDGLQGYARRDFDTVRGEWAWSITREHFDGELQWIGYASTLSLGVDACNNGIRAATGRHDSARISGGWFRRSAYVTD